MSEALNSKKDNLIEMKKLDKEKDISPRFVTATSLFDGHDASINIMRRILQDKGAEVIHLGHNRSVGEVLQAALEEDVQGIALSSYQGGHVEYFKYLFDLLKENGSDHVQIFGGGGGVIVQKEIEDLQNYGISRIYSPEDGRLMGLEGMIGDMVEKTKFSVLNNRKPVSGDFPKWKLALARAISHIVEGEAVPKKLQKEFTGNKNPLFVGVTGTGGAGKSSLLDELLLRYQHYFPEWKIAVLAIDPTRSRTKGALLGDRIRMNSIYHPNIYLRSLATRGQGAFLEQDLQEILRLFKSSIFDLVIVETAGIGQGESQITKHVDMSLYVMTAEFGAPTQLEKIDMLDLADIIVLNKFDKSGSLDALKAVKKQYKRNRKLFNLSDNKVPVYPTLASHFNDHGCNFFFMEFAKEVIKRRNCESSPEFGELVSGMPGVHSIIPGRRIRYLSEIADSVRNYHLKTRDLAEKAKKAQSYFTVLKEEVSSDLNPDGILTSGEGELETKFKKFFTQIPEGLREDLKGFKSLKVRYDSDENCYEIRGKEIRVQNFKESLSGLNIPKVRLPASENWDEQLKFLRSENIPGHFPFTAGVFPFKREGEDPIRMFAGEGGPERTNKRFHYLSLDAPAKRLSTAFDSVTLYGEDPDNRPDIYGKVGNAGVSIPTVDCAKKLYSGFDLSAKNTSVSMTINGPAPIILAFYFNAAIDQAVETYLKEKGILEETLDKLKKQEPWLPSYFGDLPESSDQLGLASLGFSGDQLVDKKTYEKIKTETLKKVRGTVQADILKEDQAQNTCIYSIDFAMKMMGDVQEYFSKNGVRNFYSVSISGYHIAEAGANPISQVAFTLANGFSLVEYYLSRGMKIDDFAANLSFFFSNGMDPEYAVIGRVARRIWAIAMRDLYGANERSQKLKYHIQTSGRSLHAQEIDFNDIRTTLQAFYALCDNCNSLHTNAYDEAITTPTEESVRRAVAVQLILGKELGLLKNENPMQGSYLMDYLTDRVEEAILEEFDRITERGGVLGAMETMYQRGKIQDESLYYEELKHNGELPIIGVNTFLPDSGQVKIPEVELSRSSEGEKLAQIKHVENFKKRNAKKADKALQNLRAVALAGENTFESLLEAAKYATLGQISSTLYSVGGKYRRNM